MEDLFLNARFDGEPLDARLQWHSPPTRWSIDRSRLVVFTDAETDFWQRTHYGFRADDGHFLGLPVAGDFLLSTRVHFLPVHQYDQAGLMVRFSQDCWLKTSVEFEPTGPCRLGVVVTQGGYSDWSTQDFSRDRHDLELRVRKQGDDFTVEYLEPPKAGAEPGAGTWTQIRLVHLSSPEGLALQAGLYACSPKGEGFRAEFEWLRIEVLA